MISGRPVLFDGQNSRLVLRGQSVAGTTLVYHGWILTPGDYTTLENLVHAQDAELFVSAGAYRQSQFIDGWLDVFADVTPATTIFPYDVQEQVLLDTYGGADGSFVVKGGSKSLKHDWERSMFAASGSAVVDVVKSFRDQVSAEEEACIAVRRYENWLPGELRVFWVNSVPCVQHHPNNTSPPQFGSDPSFDRFLNGVLKPLVEEMESPFVLTDVVMSVDGSYRVVEVGDGQVSQAADFAALHQHLTANAP